MLVLSGRADLRTPLEDARRTAAQYPNAKLLAVPGVGHSVLGTDVSGCAVKGMIAFLRAQTIAPCSKTAGLAPLQNLSGALRPGDRRSAAPDHAQRASRPDVQRGRRHAHRRGL